MKNTIWFSIHIIEFPNLSVWDIAIVNWQIILTADNRAERRAGCEKKNNIFNLKLIITKFLNKQTNV